MIKKERIEDRRGGGSRGGAKMPGGMAARRPKIAKKEMAAPLILFLEEQRLNKFKLDKNACHRERGGNFAADFF